MPRLFVISAFLFLCVPFFLAAAEPVFSGILESRSDTYFDKGGLSTWALKQYANLRFSVKAGSKGTVFGAVNVRAFSSEHAELATDGELERLYYSVALDNADVDAGFMRIAFGYGQAFRPSDIINPPNPLYPDARPLGVLASLVSVYPTEELKLRFFGADPGSSRPLAGIAADYHSPALSAQALYALRAGVETGSLPVSLGGASLKFDAGAGFSFDALCTYDGESSECDVEAAAGSDYSFFDGDLSALVQYLYGGADFGHTHYLYGALSFRIDDFTHLEALCLAGLEDCSFQPLLALEHEPFQGMTLRMDTRMPLDRTVFGGYGEGEFGPEKAGYRASLTLSAKLRF